VKNQKKLNIELKPMTQSEFSEKLEKSERDIATGNIYSQQDVERYCNKKGD
jgi:hypothetical protein